MTTFYDGQPVKLKDDVARELETTVGTWDKEFRQLVGVVGTLQRSQLAEDNEWDFIWVFTAPKKRFVVTEAEIEAVQA